MRCQPPVYCPRSVIRSPSRTGASSVCVSPRTASLTRISICSARSPPGRSQRTSRNVGCRSQSRKRTVRTVAPGATASSKTLRRVPSPPTNRVTQATASTVTWTIADCCSFTGQSACHSGSTPGSRLPRSAPRSGAESAHGSTRLSSSQARLSGVPHKAGIKNSSPRACNVSGRGRPVFRSYPTVSYQTSNMRSQ